jgi:DNA-binding HxlR family transcriptional regulator
MGRGIEPDVFNAECPAQRALDLLADKWTLLVLLALLGGPKRHGLLRRKIGGVTQKMLTQTLRRLEADGLVQRAALSIKPPQVEYSLTPLGVSLRGPILALSTWAEAHAWDIEEARQSYSTLPSRPRT